MHKQDILQNIHDVEIPAPAAYQDIALTKNLNHKKWIQARSQIWTSSKFRCVCIRNSGSISDKEMPKSWIQTCNSIGTSPTFKGFRSSVLIRVISWHGAVNYMRILPFPLPSSHGEWWGRRAGVTTQISTGHVHFVHTWMLILVLSYIKWEKFQSEYQRVGFSYPTKVFTFGCYKVSVSTCIHFSLQFLIITTHQIKPILAQAKLQDGPLGNFQKKIMCLIFDYVTFFFKCDCKPSFYLSICQ